MSPAARVLALLVTLYRRLVSPLLPARCRFAPTCSAYATQALQQHGARRGTWLASRAVARCHPFPPGGHDPVPPARPFVSDDAGSGPARRHSLPRPPGAPS